MSIGEIIPAATRTALVVAAALLAGPAAAVELRDLCPGRPGFGTSPCIVDKGHVLIESGAAWQRDRNADSIYDHWTLGETTLRYGVTETLEISADWTAFGHLRSRDRTTREVSRRSGVGDLTLGAKLSLQQPDGSGVSIALLPFVTFATGSGGIGDDGSRQGMIVPMSFDLGSDFALGLSPEIDRVRDTERHGHHLAYAGAAGLSRQFDTVTLGIEAYVERDDDPDDAATTAIGDITLAWQPRDDLQFDAEVDIGLNRASPDLCVAVGFARRF